VASVRFFNIKDNNKLTLKQFPVTVFGFQYTQFTTHNIIMWTIQHFDDSVSKNTHQVTHQIDTCSGDESTTSVARGRAKHEMKSAMI